jgi:hypothetical protein
MSGQPVKPGDLTPDERDAVFQLGKGGMQPLLPRDMTDRLATLGLAEQKLGGFVLTQHGRSIFHAIR